MESGIPGDDDDVVDVEHERRGEVHGVGAAEGMAMRKVNGEIDCTNPISDRITSQASLSDRCCAAEMSP